MDVAPPGPSLGQGRRRGRASGRGERVFRWLALAVIVVTLALFADLLPALYGVKGLLLSQVFVLLVPTVLLTAAWGLDPVATLRLGRPPAVALVGALVAAFGLLPLATGLAVGAGDLAPARAEQTLVNGAIGEPTGESGAVVVLALVVVPAMAEEALFRGLLLDRFERRLGPVAAVAVTAVLFGLAHRGPQRLLPQVLLGTLAGGIVLRGGSLWPAVVLHAAYNAGILWLGKPLLAWNGPSAWMIGLLLTAAGAGAIACGPRAEFT